MANINYEYIDRFLLGMIPEQSGILKDMEEYAKENNVPIITPDIARLLTVLIKTANVKAILEIGTAIGYSAVHMCLCAGEGCSITTIERNEESEHRIGLYKEGRMEDRIKIVTGIQK